MSIADKLTTIANNVPLVYEAGKAAGGGGAPVEEKDVNFWDYDGTLLYSYTLEEAQALAELPPAPTPKKDFLVFDEWNWTLEKIKSAGMPVDVGANYTTIDDATRLVVDIPETFLEWELNFRQDGANGLRVDWGDGGAEETSATSGATSLTHTYSQAGLYTIRLTPVYRYGNSARLGRGGAETTAFRTPATGDKRAIKEVYFGPYLRINTYGLRSEVCLSTMSLHKTNDSFHGSELSSCRALTWINIPKNAASLSREFARDCSSLRGVAGSENLNSLGVYALYNAVITKLRLPVVQVSAYALQGVSPLRATNPIVTQAAQNVAARDCMVLEEVEIADGTLAIPQQCFYNCFGLTKVTIAASVETISTKAFGYDHQLTEVHVKAETPPTMESADVFAGILVGSFIIYVPSGTLAAYQAATNWAVYADYMREE